MSASYQYIISSGTILADTFDIQSDVEGEWQTALGADLVTTADTPQGMLITQEVQARTNVMNNNAAVGNQINPNLAGGVYLEAICALMGIYRVAASFSQYEGVILTGVQGTPIPLGIQAQTTNGDIFKSESAVTLDPVTGTATVNFLSTEAGAVPGPAGTLSIMASTAVLGLETITAPADAIPGQGQQTDSQLRQARIQKLGRQGKTGPATIIAALQGDDANAGVPGVTSVKFLENVADTVQVIQGITMAAHSVWVCVAGGADADVALALLSSKGVGANWNGATFVTVNDPSSGQPYTVQFDRPTLIPCKVILTYSQGSSSNDISSTGPQAIIDYQNGLLPDTPGLTIGTSVSPFDLSAAVLEENPGCRVRNLQVALSSTGVFQNTEIPMAINQQATIAKSDIATVLE